MFEVGKVQAENNGPLEDYVIEKGLRMWFQKEEETSARRDGKSLYLNWKKNQGKEQYVS